MRASSKLLLLLVSFILLGSTISTDKQDNQVWEVCLEIQSINLEHLTWGPDSRNAKTSPQGVLYAYSADEPVDTFQMFQFSIAASSPPPQLLPSSFNFEGKDSLVGCWAEPPFHELDVRFKLYQHHYTALKATSTVPIPSITSATLIDGNVTLNTLPYRYHDVTVVVAYSLQWTLKASTRPSQIQSTPASNDAGGAFDSDEVADAMMTNDFSTDKNQDTNYSNDRQPSDWMLTAAFAASIVGLLMLLLVCIRAYKHCVRSEYDQIYMRSYDKVCKSDKSLARIRKISLRNVDGSDERKRIIIPSGPSYT